MDLQQLLDEREIYRQLVRFARAMDQRDWQALEQVTTEDFISDTGMGDIAGRQACIDFMRSFLDHCGTTQHLLGNVLIEVGGDRATSVASVCDMHLASDEQSGTSFRTLGEYRDEWVRVDGQWRMCRRRKDNRATHGSMSVFSPND